MRIRVLLPTIATVYACSTAATSPQSPADAAAGDAAASDGAAHDGGASTDATGAKDAPACKLTKPYSTKDVGCNQCAEAHCCEAVDACYADADCDDGYVNCILACVILPDDAGADADTDGGVARCTAQCDAQYPDGKVEYDAITTCIEHSCATECQ